MKFANHLAADERHLEDLRLALFMNRHVAKGMEIDWPGIVRKTKHYRMPWSGFVEDDDNDD